MLPAPPMFHHFHGTGPDGLVHPPGQGSIDADCLDRLIRRLQQCHTLLPAGEWLDRRDAGRLGPRDLCLSFDDGLRCQLDIALPVVETHGLTALLFVHTAIYDGVPNRMELYRYYRSTQFDTVEAFYAAFDNALRASPEADSVAAGLKGVDIAAYRPNSPFYTDADRRFRYIRDEILDEPAFHAVMDAMIADWIDDPAEIHAGLWIQRDRLVSLSRVGHVVGLHTHTHLTNFPAVPADRQRFEFHRNAEMLAEFGLPPARCASYPCGKYNGDSLAILGDMGVGVAFRADPAVSDPARPLEWPRIDHAVLCREHRLPVT